MPVGSSAATAAAAAESLSSMQLQHPREPAKCHTTRSSRSSSVGSDAVPAPIVSSLRTVPAAKPTPSYVAAAAASELVTNNHQLALNESAYDDGETPPSPAPNEVAVFSAGGLAMVNAFLDQLLYNFLIHSRGTTLAALRQSVEQVLKGKLAAYAMASADEELEELLNDDELDENLMAVEETESGTSMGDVEAIFWRTRLRVMVYMRLGEMEDEDEELYVDEAQVFLQKGTAKKRLSLNTGLVSWAAAIFLTSILEFIAEQCLNVAGQAAFDRMAVKRLSSTGYVAPEEEERITVEDYDTERVALSSTLGRLWRTWRKSLRSPHSRNVSGSMSLPGSRKPSVSTIRLELLGRQRAEGISRNASVNKFEAIRSSTNGRMLPFRAERGSATSDEGAKINAVRIHRLSQRPRSLIIEPTKRSDRNRDSRGVFLDTIHQEGSFGRKRSRSLPSIPRAAAFASINPPQVGTQRPRTASRLEQGASQNDSTENTASDLKSGSNGVTIRGQGEPGSYNNARYVEAAESHTSDVKPAGPSPQDSAFYDRPVVIRRPVPVVENNDSINSQTAQNNSAQQDPARSAESFTSTEEDDETQMEHSPEHSRAVANGLGIHGASDARDFPAQSVRSGSYSQGPTQYGSPVLANSATRANTRSTPYHEPMVRSVKSFEREEKSFVRRLSNSSSKHSNAKSNNPVTQRHFSARPSQETLGSPQSTSTSRSGYIDKGFGDFVAGEETVKLTLTPRTLQEIESKNSPRYKEREVVALNKDGSRKHNLSEQELANAQRAVIASMNASLRKFSPSGDIRANPNYPVSASSVANPSSVIPPVPRAAPAETTPLPTRAMQEEPQARVDPRSVHDIHTHSTRPSQDQPYPRGAVGGSYVQTKSPPQANPPSGWFSARTSMEASRAAKANVTNHSARNPSGSLLGQKKSNPLLQPREAVVARRGENDDLVAFLKSTGPPGVQVYRGANGGSAETYTNSSIGRTSSSMTPSIHDSLNSHKALLSPGTAPPSGATQANGTMPQKKRSRIRDPYALPSDDEYEDGLTALPSSRSETLVDFLRNVPPPPTSVPSANGNASSSSSARLEPVDTKYANRAGASGGRSIPASPSSPSGRSLKGKGSVKALWKKIGA